MIPEPKKPPPEPTAKPDEDDEFAEEAAPKSSEFDTEEHAKQLTDAEFELIP